MGVTDILAPDIGGGSTEFILDRLSQRPIMRSIDIGVVRLCERVLRHDPPTIDEIQQARNWVRRKRRPSLLIWRIVGKQHLSALPARIHNYRLKLETNRELEPVLLSRTKTERVGLPGLEKNREEVIAAGAIIIQAIMETLGQQSVLVSDLGLREC